VEFFSIGVGKMQPSQGKTGARRQALAALNLLSVSELRHYAQYLNSPAPTLPWQITAEK
jgi:hypothetical protein